MNIKNILKEINLNKLKLIIMTLIYLPLVVFLETNNYIYIYIMLLISLIIRIILSNQKRLINVDYFVIYMVFVIPVLLIYFYRQEELVTMSIFITIFLSFRTALFK